MAIAGNGQPLCEFESNRLVFTVVFSETSMRPRQGLVWTCLDRRVLSGSGICRTQGNRLYSISFTCPDVVPVIHLPVMVFPMVSNQCVEQATIIEDVVSCISSVCVCARVVRHEKPAIWHLRFMWTSKARVICSSELYQRMHKLRISMNVYVHVNTHFRTCTKAQVKVLKKKLLWSTVYVSACNCTCKGLLSVSRQSNTSHSAMLEGYTHHQTPHHTAGHISRHIWAPRQEESAAIFLLAACCYSWVGGPTPKTIPGKTNRKCWPPTCHGWKKDARLWHFSAA